MKSLVVACLSLALLSGCASIIKHGGQGVSFRSTPEGATVSITNRAGKKIHRGTTPLTLRLKRGAGYFRAERYVVRFEMDGYSPKEMTLKGSVNGWYFGNIIFGGLVGLFIVDPLTGAMYTLKPDDVEIALEALNVAKTSGGNLSMTVVLAQELPPEVMARAQLIQ